MRNDLILKTMIGFLIPILMLYSGFLLFSQDGINFVSLLNSFIYIMLSYILFYLRFSEVNIKRLISLKIVTNIALIVLFVFLLLLLLNLVN